MGCGATSGDQGKTSTARTGSTHNGSRPVTPGRIGMVLVLPPDGHRDSANSMGLADEGMSRSVWRLEQQHKHRQAASDDPDLMRSMDLTHSPAIMQRSALQKSMQGRSVLGMTRMMSSFRRELDGFMGSRDKVLETDGAANDDVDSETRLTRLFDMMDTGKTGRVSLQQLQLGWRKLGWAHSQKALAQMFKIAGDGSDHVTRPAFNKFFRELASVEDLQNWDPDNDEWLQTRLRRRPQRGRQYAWGERPLLNYDCVTHLGLSNRVKCICLDPSRPFYISAHCGNASVQVADLDTGDTLRAFYGHRDTVMTVAISPDLKVLATGSRDADVILWEVVTGHMMQSMRHSGVVTCCSFSADGKQLVTGGVDAVCSRYAVKGGKLKCVSDELGVGVVVTVAHTEKKLAASLSGQTSVQVLDAKSLQVLQLLEGHSSSVWSLHFSYRPELESRAVRRIAGEDEEERIKVKEKEPKKDRKERRQSRTKMDAEQPSKGRMLTVCKQYIKVWDVSGGFRLLHDFTVPPRLAAPPPAAAAPGTRAPVARLRRWICATFVGGDFGHLIVAALSDNAIVILEEPPSCNVLATITTRAPVYCLSAALDQNDVVCGDEFGNIYRLTLS
eukprot:TRINITY_DN13261_c0_g1_i1.p1 TRINITY_DN13261_c0_g1~~TRINITY_DN13261_c0_g1_i1.p1  ORF type:complete len:651 (+),score=173.43 TRINITY_DN13261_c0_g1_i1:113-1954(+)